MRSARSRPQHLYRSKPVFDPPRDYVPDDLEHLFLGRPGRVQALLPKPMTEEEFRAEIEFLDRRRGERVEDAPPAEPSR